MLNYIKLTLFFALVLLLHNTTMAQYYSQQVTQAEYFWGAVDPGTGNGTALIANDGNFSDAIEAVIASGINVPSSGLNILNVRVKGNNGTWGGLFKTVVNRDSSFSADIHVTQSEYYIDTDNGAGSNIALLAFDGNYNDAIEAAFQSGINSPSFGLHTLGVRFKGLDGTWGPVFKSIFNVDSTFVADLKLTTGEYFFDTDPGAGSATPLLALDGNYTSAIETALAGSINTPSTGLHTINVRFKGLDGTWGALFTTVISMDSQFSADLKLISAEYYFDTDPGPGNGTAMIAADGSFNNVIETAISSAATNALSVGNHVLAVRMKGLDGTWGPTFRIVVIVDPCVPQPSASITAGGSTTFCPGDSVTLSANTGVGLTYQWRKDGGNISGATSSTYNAKTTGVYDVLITNTGNCSNVSNSITVTVAGNSSPEVTIIASPGTSICPGASITFTATPTNGGTIPVYQWQVNGNNVGTNSSTYSSSVLNNNDAVTCIMTTSASCVFPLDDTSNVLNITVYATPSSTVNTSGPTTICQGGSVTLSALPGYTYNWNTAATTQSINVTTTGTGFKVTVTSANGCTAVSSPIDVTVNSNPTASITPASPAICVGANTTLTASGGISYLWNTNATTSAITVSPSATTTYTVTVTNANSCTASASKTVTVNGIPNAAISPASPSVCTGQSTTLTASGGGFYVWNTGGTTAAISVSPITNTSYNVTVTSAGGCYASANVTVTVNGLPTASVNPTLATICTGQSTTLTGSGGVTYSWNTGATTAAISVNPLGNTTYIVTAINSNGCTASASSTVTVNPAPPANVSPSNSTICSGQLTTLTASGGTNYSWSNGQTTAAINIAPVSTTTYTVTVTGANGCTNTATGTVTVNAAPNVAINPQVASICTGQNATLTASGGGTYLWSNSATTAAITVNPLTTTTYTVTVTSGNCSVTAAVTVNVSTNLTPVITPSSPSVCIGQSTTLTVTSGTSYTWNTGTTTQGIAVSPIVNTTYSVTVSNGTGCSGSTSTIVTVHALPNAPTITPGGSTTICQGDSLSLTSSAANAYLWSTTATTQNIIVSQGGSYSVTITDVNGCLAVSSPETVTINATPDASVSANGATVFCAGGNVILSAQPGLNYNWSNGASTQSTTVSQSGNYNVTVTDGNGCSSVSLPVTITVNASPDATITPGGATNICIGGSVDLSAAAGLTYIWSTTETTQTITVSTSGNYTLTVTDGIGCPAVSAPVNVQVGNNPSVNITPAGTQNICQGNSVTLTASQGNSYLWSNTQTTQSISANQAGTYSVTVIISAGCSGTASSTVNVNPLPDATITTPGTTNVCEGSSITLSAQPGLLYQWSSSATTRNISVSLAGNYYVTVTNANGCSAISSPAAVNVLPLPQPVIIQSNDTLFTGNYSAYQWLLNGSEIANATTMQVHVTQNGDYGVIVTDANGCSDTSALKNVTGIGINEAIGGVAVKLYPNPNTGNFILEFSGNAEREVVITDMLGRMIVSSTPVQKQHEFSLNETAAGIYFLRITEGKQVKNLKFIIVL